MIVVSEPQELHCFTTPSTIGQLHCPEQSFSPFIIGHSFFRFTSGSSSPKFSPKIYNLHGTLSSSPIRSPPMAAITPDNEAESISGPKRVSKIFGIEYLKSMPFDTLP